VRRAMMRDESRAQAPGAWVCRPWRARTMREALAEEPCCGEARGAACLGCVLPCVAAGRCGLR
jgi:hypothetical protein